MTDEERQSNLDARAQWNPVMDLADAHRTLRERGQYITDLIKRPGSTQVWRYMARLARAFEGHDDYLDSRLAATYVRHSLGRGRSCTFLTELEPFPSRRPQQPVELQNFTDQKQLAEVRARRHREQIELLRQARPKAVICYGTKLGDQYATRFGIEWRPLVTVCWRSKKSGSVCERIVYHAELRNNECHVSKFFLLPFFGQGQLSDEVIRRFVETGEFQGCRR